MKLSLLGCVVLVASAAAQVQLHSLFQDAMVLQRDVAVPISGTAKPGELVAVTLGQRTVRTRADSSGNWSVKCGPLAAGGPYQIVVSASNQITVRDVLAGEVWLCSGQSNMEWAMHQSADPEREIAAANLPEVRLFRVQRTISSEPRTAVVGKWETCRPETVKDFSAVGYHFARELQQRLQVPVGIIQSAWGGTAIEAWMSRESLVRPDVAAALERWDAKLSEVLAARVQWRDASTRAQAEGAPPPEPPPEITDPNCATVLFNGMIAPLVGFKIRGVLWYQGESNAGRAYQYRALLPAMILDWRRLWGVADLPFYFVQLASFKTKQPATWAELREAQSMTLSLPRTGMAVTTDIGDPADIHPKNKREVGRRLSLWAMAQCYGARDLPHSGPIFRRLAAEGGGLRVWFDHGRGLAARDGALAGFEVATETGDFVPAEARIVDDSVVVSSPAVTSPAHVRYGWTDDCSACNLVNGAGLPASPFRTDQRPGVTAKAR